MMGHDSGMEDFTPEGVGTDTRSPGLHAAAVAILTQAAGMERRTWGEGDEPWTGPREPIDFPGWLSAVLMEVAENIGGADDLIAGRSGSWEAEHVRALAGGY